MSTALRRTVGASPRRGKDITALDGVSLDLKAGVVGLIGHNGAGKTTLMQMIATLTRPTSGQILFQGADIAARPDAIRHAGYGIPPST